METASYFLKYIPPIIFSFLNVAALAAINYLVYKLLPSNRGVESIEVLAYSIRSAGPIAFALSFLFFFYGMELLKEEWFFARIVFMIDAVMLVIGFILNIVFLSRL